MVYNPAKISFVDILRWFWESHDPTQGMGQGNDRGTQYRSGFYWVDEEQRQLIQASKEAYGKALKDAKGLGPITTETRAASDFPVCFVSVRNRSPPLPLCLPAVSTGSSMLRTIISNTWQNLG